MICSITWKMEQTFRNIDPKNLLLKALIVKVEKELELKERKMQKMRKRLKFQVCNQHVVVSN